MTAVWVAVAVLVLTVAGLSVALASTGTSPSAGLTPFGSSPATTAPSGGVFGGGNTGTAPSFGQNSGSGNSGSPTPGSGGTGSGPAATPNINTSGIAAAVDPGLVDINTTLAQGGGAAGTGMVLTSSGLVLTNNHVIENAESIEAQVIGTGTEYQAKVLGYSVTDDVALVQLENASGLTTVTTGHSSGLSVGQPVVAIGNALGKGGTPSAVSGTVTALGQTITAGDPGTIEETLHNMIEMSDPIQSGDSGGPVVDAAGKVVGMNTAASENSGGFGAQSSTQAYAIGIDDALSVVDQIKAGKASATVQIGPRGLLGVEVADGGSQGGGAGGASGNSGTTGGSSTPGAYVEQTEAGSPAATAGIAAGDTIVSVNGTTVSSAGDLTAALLGDKPGDTVSVGWVDASGNQHSADIELTTGPPA